MSELIYANAPLVEVIAEIRWKTIKLRAIPEGGVDPYYEILLSTFRNKINHLGFLHEEKLVPDDIPRELLAGQVTTRFRRQANRWPLFQIGPGVFTANIVPPYDGWTSFAPILAQGIRCLVDSYPEAGKLMTLDRMSLRYIDAFTAKHAWKDGWSFHSEGLQHKIERPTALTDLGWLNASPRNVAFNLEYDVSKPKASVLSTQVAGGTAGGQDATILTLDMVQPKIERTPDVDELIQWFDDAHEALSEAFRAIISKEVTDLMGPAKEVKPK